MYVLFKNKESFQLLEWMKKHQTSKFPFFQTFIAGLKDVLSAVLNSVQEQWNDRVNRLKNIKRMIYG